jgi:F0F1-type ATP synthase membrane subunit b/b'
MAAATHLSKLTEEQLRDAFEKIKAIEGKASKVLDDVKKERASFNRRVYNEIESRKKELKEETERDINLIKQLADTEVEKRTAEIERDKQNDIAKTDEQFAANRDAWRKKIFDNILAGI